MENDFEYTDNTHFGPVSVPNIPDGTFTSLGKAIMIAINGENDGPYFHYDNTHDWDKLNQMCHSLLDKNLFDVGQSFFEENEFEVGAIDCTDTNEFGWCAWVTGDADVLFENIKNVLIEALKEAYPNWSKSNVVAYLEHGMTKEEVEEFYEGMFYDMLESDEDFCHNLCDLFEHSAKKSGSTLDTEITIIDSDELIEYLTEEFKNSHQCGIFSGWRTPIYIDEDAELSSGGWLSSGSYAPGEIEICSVEGWDITDIEGYYEEDDEGNPIETWDSDDVGEEAEKLARFKVDRLMEEKPWIERGEKWIVE